jgi:multidrug efflux pump
LQGPSFDDEFGDVFGSVYAFTADGMSMRQLRDYVEQVRAEIRDGAGVGQGR